MSKRILKECRDKVSSIEIVYQCEFETQMRTPGNPIYNFFNSSTNSLSAKTKSPPPMAPRSGLRGGCVEVFDLVGKADDEFDIHYWDINRFVISTFFSTMINEKHSLISSLYPFICMQHKFVVGAGIRLKGPKMTSRLNLHPEKGMFVYHDPSDDVVKEIDGIVQVVIGVPRDNHDVNQLPFLPIRIDKGKDKNKSFRGTCKRCLMEKRKTLCKHDMLKRRWRDTYTVKEVGYAVCQLGYTLYSIDEALIYTNLQPIFESFMRLMASKKIKYGKVPASYQKDLPRYCQEVNQLMSFTRPGEILTPDLLVENIYQCSFIKSIMNICIGKLSQSPIQKTVEFVQGEERRTQIFTDDSLEVSSCFAVTDSCDQITYQKKTAT